MSDLSDYMTAAEAVDRLALQYQQMVLASAALRDLGRLKQIKTEAEAAQARAQEATSAAADKMAQAGETMAQAQIEAAAIVERANDQAQAKVAEAETAASERRAEADSEASRAIQAAKDAGARITQAAQATLAKLQEQIDAASEDLVNKRAERDSVLSQVAEAEGQLAAARDAVRKLMGG